MKNEPSKYRHYKIEYVAEGGLLEYRTIKLVSAKNRDSAINDFQENMNCEIISVEEQ